jgi:hypothetical protein
MTSSSYHPIIPGVTLFHLLCLQTVMDSLSDSDEPNNLGSQDERTLQPTSSGAALSTHTSATHWSSGPS